MVAQQKELLVVTKDRSIQLQLHWFFRGYAIRHWNGCADEMDVMRHSPPNVVLLDLDLPSEPNKERQGILALECILSVAPEAKVIAFTENTERAVAVEAISLGVQDVFHKPIDMESLVLVVARAFHVRALELENSYSDQSDHPKEAHFQLAAASSPEMKKIVSIVKRVAPTDIPVMFSGEVGTGKELFAESVHRLSERCQERFVSVNCAAIPEDRIEAELFGVEPSDDKLGAKIGDIEAAHNGTLFLNNVCALPPVIQTKLLFFLQHQKLYRVGAYNSITVDTRIISATPGYIKLMVSESKFREDLYRRLNGINIDVPALKDRPGDTIFIAQALLKKFTSEFKVEKKNFTSDAVRAIESHAWPGNLIEMENKIRRAVIMSADKQLTVDDLGLCSVKKEKEVLLNLRQAREEADRRVLLGALTEADSNISGMASLLGVARPTVYKLLQKFHIQI